MYRRACDRRRRCGRGARRDSRLRENGCGTCWKVCNYIDGRNWGWLAVVVVVVAVVLGVGSSRLRVKTRSALATEPLETQRIAS